MPPLATPSLVPALHSHQHFSSFLRSGNYFLLLACMQVLKVHFPNLYLAIVGPSGCHLLTEDFPDPQFQLRFQPLSILLQDLVFHYLPYHNL